MSDAEMQSSNFLQMDFSNGQVTDGRDQNIHDD